MAINQFLPFATGNGANVYAPDVWATIATQQTGFVSGIASSTQINTAIRQASTMSAALGKFIVDHAAVDVKDDGDVPAIANGITAAIDAMLQPVNNRISNIESANNAVDAAQAQALISLNSALQLNHLDDVQQTQVISVIQGLVSATQAAIANESQARDSTDQYLNGQIVATNSNVVNEANSRYQNDISILSLLNDVAKNLPLLTIYFSTHDNAGSPEGSVTILDSIYGFDRNGNKNTQFSYAGYTFLGGGDDRMFLNFNDNSGGNAFGGQDGDRSLHLFAEVSATRPYAGGYMTWTPLMGANWNADGRLEITIDSVSVTESYRIDYAVRIYHVRF